MEPESMNKTLRRTLQVTCVLLFCVSLYEFSLLAGAKSLGGSLIGIIGMGLGIWGLFYSRKRD